MGDRMKAFWLGIFIIIGIAITAWLILFLKPSVGNGELTLKVRFSNIDKIEVGTRVTFAGKPIGVVERIKEVAHPRQSPADEFGNLYIFELTLKVDSSVAVYTYDEIIFATSGLLGEKSIAIMPKAAPPGAPPPQNVTHDILFAKSTDKLEVTLNKLTQAAETVGDAIEGVNHFISANADDFNKTLKSVTGAAREMQVFLQEKAPQAADALTMTMGSAHHLITKIQDTDLVERLGKSFDQIYEVGNQITQGEGTLGQLIHSDSLYLQLSGLFCKVDTLLNDINHYGLLFQYDKGWQRARTARINRMRQLCTPCDFYSYMDHEISEISITLSRVGALLHSREIPIQNECFDARFLELMAQVDSLRGSLKLYTEMLVGEYCQN